MMKPETTPDGARTAPGLSSVPYPSPRDSARSAVETGCGQHVTAERAEVAEKEGSMNTPPFRYWTLWRAACTARRREGSPTGSSRIVPQGTNHIDKPIHRLNLADRLDRSPTTRASSGSKLLLADVHAFCRVLFASAYVYCVLALLGACEDWQACSGWREASESFSLCNLLAHDGPTQRVGSLC